MCLRVFFSIDSGTPSFSQIIQAPDLALSELYSSIVLCKETLETSWRTSRERNPNLRRSGSHEPGVATTEPRAPRADSALWPNLATSAPNLRDLGGFNEPKRLNHRPKDFNLGIIVLQDFRHMNPECLSSSGDLSRHAGSPTTPIEGIRHLASFRTMTNSRPHQFREPSCQYSNRARTRTHPQPHSHTPTQPSKNRQAPNIWIFVESCWGLGCENS